MTSLDLVPRYLIGSLDLTDYPFLVNQEGIDYQAGDFVTAVLASFLIDGELEMTSRRGNMGFSIPVLIEATDLRESAASLAALSLEAEKQSNTFTVDPGDGFGAVTVFDIFKVDVSYSYNPKFEQAGIRQYLLTFRALPAGRSAVETVVSALAPAPATPTNVTISDGTSAAGWVGTFNRVNSAPAPVVSSGGILSVTSDPNLTVEYIAAHRVGSVTFGTTRYLAVDWWASGTIPPTMRCGDGAFGYDKVYEGPAATAGYTRSIFQVPTQVSSVNDLFFEIQYPVYQFGTPTSLRIDQVYRTDTVPGTSGKQSLRTLAIGGSMPTVGSVSVEHETLALGDALLYTCPLDAGGYSPALTPYRTGAYAGSAMGSRTTSSAAVSGGYDTLNGSTPDLWYEGPAGAFPEGDYLLMARIQATAGSSLLWQVGSNMNGQPAAPVTDQQTIPLPEMASWTFFRLGVVHVPTVDLGALGKALVVLRRAAGTVLVDETYLFNLTTGDLTQVACGTGALGSNYLISNRLWVDSPALENEGLGRLLRGLAADQTDAVSAYPQAASIGVHRFVPPGVKAFVVTSNAPAPAVNFRAYKRWHLHAVD